MGQATSLEHKGKNAKKIALILDESHFKRKKEKKERDSNGRCVLATVSGEKLREAALLLSSRLRN